MIFQLILILCIFNVTQLASAQTTVIISSENTPPEEIQTLLDTNKNYVSLIDYLKTTTGVPDSDVIDQVHDLVSDKGENHLSNSHRAHELIQSLASGYLSPIKKSLLQKILQKTNTKVVFRGDFSSLIHAEVKSGSIHANKVIQKRSDDEIFINGVQLSHSELAKVTFASEYFYHIAYLSNTYEPVFLWARGDQIPEIKLAPLIEGSCENFRYSKPVSLEINELGLFPKGCLKLITKAPMGNIEGNKMYFNRIEAPELKRELTLPHRTWIFGGLALLMIATHELRKEYDIQLRWNF